jgi:hypothetical protein
VNQIGGQQTALPGVKEQSDRMQGILVARRQANSRALTRNREDYQQSTIKASFRTTTSTQEINCKHGAAEEREGEIRSMKSTLSFETLITDM